MTPNLELWVPETEAGDTLALALIKQHKYSLFDSDNPQLAINDRHEWMSDNGRQWYSYAVTIDGIAPVKVPRHARRVFAFSEGLHQVVETILHELAAAETRRRAEVPA